MGSMTDNHVIVGDGNEIKEPYVLPSSGARQHFALIDLALIYSQFKCIEEVVSDTNKKEP